MPKFPNVINHFLIQVERSLVELNDPILVSILSIQIQLKNTNFDNFRVRSELPEWANLSRASNSRKTKTSTAQSKAPPVI